MGGPTIQQSMFVSRQLPLPTPDGGTPQFPPRAGRYNEQTVLSPVPTKHLLADEGGYVTAGMLPGATSLQLGLSATFSATGGFIVLQNTDSPSNTNAKRLYLDYIDMLVITPPTSATNLLYATVLDSKDRSPTTVALVGAPGTLTAYKVIPFNANMDVQVGPVGQAYFPISTSAGGPPTLPAAGPNTRTIVGNRSLRAQIPVAGDNYKIIFGGLDPTGQLVTAAPNGASRIVDSHPPVIVGPGQCFVMYMWGLSNATAGIAFAGLDMGWWER